MKIFLIIIIIATTFSNTVIAREFSLKERSNAIYVFCNKNSSQNDVAKSIFIFSQYKNKTKRMTYYFGLANYNLSTNIMKMNKTKGVEYIKIAADQGYTPAQMKYYRILLDAGKIKEAIVYIRMAANAGDYNAKYKIGKLYLKGVNIKQNKSIGIKLIYVAANNNVADAQYTIAKIFLNQKEQSARLNGIYWLKRAVSNGKLKACDDLYNIYIKNEIVTTDSREYIKYLTCSAFNKNKNAIYLLAKHYKTGTFVEQSIAKAGFWFKAIVDENDEAAIYYTNYILSTFPDNKEKVLKVVNLLKSKSKYSKACSMTLGFIYKSGNKWVPKSKKTAIKYFEKAKQLGAKDANSMIFEVLNETIKN